MTIARVTHAPTKGWKAFTGKLRTPDQFLLSPADYRKEYGGQCERVLAGGLHFATLADLTAYFAAVHPGVTLEITCDVCASSRDVEPVEEGFGYMLNCRRCRHLPSAYSPPSDAEAGKKLKKPRPGVSETEADFLKLTRAQLTQFELKTTGHDALDKKLRLPDAPREQRYAEQSAVIAKEDAPESCQVCDAPVVDVFVDCVFRGAGWGYACAACHKVHGIGFGVGRGQLFAMQADGHYHKIK